MSGEDFDDFREEDAIEFKQRVAKLLRRIEWRGDGHVPTCPNCDAEYDGPEGSRHRVEPECELVALIKECEA